MKTQLKENIFIEGFDDRLDCAVAAYNGHPLLYEGKTSEIPEEIAKEYILSACNQPYCIIYKLNKKTMKDFLLPEKWAVAVTEESREALGKWRAVGSVGVLAKDKYKPSGYCHSPIGAWSEYRSYDHTEITFEQFKKYVLGMKEQEQQKEIVGYRLKDECHEYLPALDCISTFFSKGNLSFAVGSYYYNDFKQAGVLDLWFTPVYADSTPQITINGYKGEFFDEYVKFGCAKFSKDVFIELNKFRMRLNCDSVVDYSTNTNRGIESVTLGKGTFAKEQIKAIAEYYLNKK